MIWCVEDDDSIRDIEMYALQSAGYETRGFEDGESFRTALQKEQPDLVLLDLMLPGVDGMELLTGMRSSPTQKNIPVIITTAKGNEYDRVKGLDQGADYYLVKPFGVMELISTVKAVLRRCKPTDSDGTLRHGAIVMNTAAHTVTADGNSVALTTKEFDLLRLFMRHPGIAFPRETLMEEIWGTDFIGESRTIDMHIKTLRQKLGEAGEMIETVRGIGYRMKAEE